MTTRIADLPIRMAATTPRATGPTPATTFRTTLAEAAGTVLAGVESASSLVPGGGTLAAAIRGGAAALTSPGGGATTTPTTGTSEAPASSGGELSGVQNVLQQSADQNMQFLQLQEQLQAENRRYSALSNALKARHETAKNSINNIR